MTSFTRLIRSTIKKSRRSLYRRWRDLIVNLSHNRQRRELHYGPPPLFIGGTGGSGTRVMVDVAESIGLYMGNSLNSSNDALTLVPVLRKWIPIYLQQERTLRPDQMQDLEDEFDSALITHRFGLRSKHKGWGAKNPIMIMFVPCLFELFPDMRFIHVVRDGRDMAFSSKPKPVEAYEDKVLDDEVLKSSLPVRLIALWANVNLAAAEFGQTLGPSQYLCVRYEDLCFKTTETVRRVIDFLGIPDGDVQAAAGFVHPSSSIGRWKQHANANFLTSYPDSVRDALLQFGYDID
jgi:Sulfotransferase family